jgi:hypothetical protein
LRLCLHARALLLGRRLAHRLALRLERLHRVRPRRQLLLQGDQLLGLFALEPRALLERGLGATAQTFELSLA